MATVQTTLEEDWQVLEEAFALIDDWGNFTSEGSSSSDGIGSRSVSEPGCINNTATILQKNATKSVLKKKRIRHPASNSTAFQRRRKVELIALRDEVTVLETQLTNLIRKNQKTWERYLDQNNRTMKNGIFRWCEEAVKQYRRRIESEKRNRKLKEIASRQLQVVGDLQTVLQQQDVLCGMDVVFAGVPQYQGTEQLPKPKSPIQISLSKGEDSADVTTNTNVIM